MTDFDKNGYKIIKNFLNEDSLNTVSRYMEYKLKRKDFTVRKLDDEFADLPSEYSCYADPLIETILYFYKSDIESACNRDLYPTYSYSRVYMKGDELKKHTDRPSCEISVTCNVAINGHPWSIWCKSPNKEPVECILNPGDAIVYKGCEVEHWRDPLKHADFNAQFMLHYVDKNGPFADYKFDKRSELGMAFDTRRM